MERSTAPDGTLALPGTYSVECFRQEPLRSRRQIWCFPHAGAGAAEFSSWPDAASKDILVCAIRLPGRERRTTDGSRFKDLYEASAAVAAEIGSLIEPTAVFYGQCFGAYLAYEVIVQLMHAGATLPRRLFVASQVAPMRTPPVLPEERISELEGTAFRAAVREIGGLPSTFPEQLWPLVEAAIRADFQLSESFEGASDVIPVPITALVGSDDSQMSPDDVQGWRALSTQDFNVQIVPGGHFLNRSSPSEVIQIIDQGATNCGGS